MTADTKVVPGRKPGRTLPHLPWRVNKLLQQSTTEWRENCGRITDNFRQLYQEVLEHFMLPYTDQLDRVAGFIPAHTTQSSTGLKTLVSLT